MKTCITCNHFHFSTTYTYAMIFTYTIQRKLIAQSDHLSKDCNYWTKKNGFAPKAALKRFLRVYDF